MRRELIRRQLIGGDLIRQRVGHLARFVHVDIGRVVVAHALARGEADIVARVHVRLEWFDIL